MTKEELISFENEIKELYEAGKIRAPVHFSGGNENKLIEIFKNVKPDDWVFSNHRSHYHALLHGVDREWLKSEILAGNSMHLNNKEHRFVTSSIVAGCVPIALGVALGIKRNGGTNHVWCFVGDMAAKTGGFNEACRYASGFALPITFVIEDNGMSTDTPTYVVWGKTQWDFDLISYSYKRKFPHKGTGKYVIFND